MTTTSRNPYLQGKFAPVIDEIVAEDLPVTGELPGDLCGTFIRNGPNPRFAPEGRHHWFDGDGMLHGVSIHEGRATYRNRYVRTKDFQAEGEAGRALWRGIQEPFDPNGSRSPEKHTGNTGLVFQAGKLLALWWLAGEAYEIDPDDFSTAGVFDAGGTLSTGVCPHPKLAAIRCAFADGAGQPQRSHIHSRSAFLSRHGHH